MLPGFAGVALPYPRAAYGLELLCILLFILVDTTRLRLGSLGNRAEQLVPLALATGLALLLVAYHVYFLGFQVYVYAPLATYALLLHGCTGHGCLER